MLKKSTNLILYHGSNCEVVIPDLRRCKKYKDFGTGFYLTTDKQQAENFAKIIARRSGYNNANAIVSVFELNTTKLDLNVKVFNRADIEWLQFIVLNRTSIYNHQYDIIFGRIADDRTYSVIQDYIREKQSGVPRLGETAEEYCIRRLTVGGISDKLKNQICFSTYKSIKSLHFKGSYTVIQ